MSFLIDFKHLLITERKNTGGRPLTDIITEAGEAGLRAVQFREKDLPLREQMKMALEIQKITQQFGMKLFINDRVDLCLCIDADGVHLPSTGLPVTVVRKMLGPKKGIGVSCHMLEDVLRAESFGADFALLGPIYDTPSKRQYGKPLGIDYLKEVRQATTIPLFAVGGVRKDKIAQVMQTGADGVAMISEIMTAENVRERCWAILNLL
ncbi:MAG: thiamine phosphate synthase [Nitrospirae bacterium]|nr:thiamine phosphate synthase [Candidatus Troglogloeales bacterium]